MHIIVQVILVHVQIFKAIFKCFISACSVHVVRLRMYTLHACIHAALLYTLNEDQGSELNTKYIGGWTGGSNSARLV